MGILKEKVYCITKQIPRGKVATYGQIAQLAGHPKAARAVGVFMRTNPYAPIVPCHRVVAKDGSLTGFSMGKGVSTKNIMLKNEGVIFKGKKVDMEKSLWNGMV